MQNTFKRRPVKSTPQQYERWIKGLEKEIRQLLEEAKNNPEVFYAKIDQQCPNEPYVSVCVLKMILGEE